MDTLARACELGLVTRAEIARGIAQTRAHVSTDAIGPVEITLRGRVVARVQRAGDGVTGRLGALLSALDEEDLGPRVVSHGDWLWTEALPGRSLADLSSAGAEPSLVELTDACVALGAALAALHRLPVPRRVVQSVRRPSVGRAARSGGDAALDAEVRHALAADPSLQRAIEAVGQRWSERHWTLGRIDPQDIVVDSRAGSRVRFANLESAGLGCADWDVAACLASIAQVAGTADSVVWLSEHFQNSYRRAGGPGQVHPQVQAMHAVDAAGRAAQDGDAAAVRWWLTRAHDAVIRGRGVLSRAA